MPASYNLIDEPWIPCYDMQGGFAEHGIRDTLEKSHEIYEVRDASPLVTAGVLRFLLALVYRVYGPLDEEEHKHLWEAERFPPEPLRDYLAKWHDRFDLFHPQTPFYQDASLRGELKTIAYLAAEKATGTNVAHFSHDQDADSSLTPKECARCIVSLSAFATQGGQGNSPSLNGAPPVYCYWSCEDLHKTLLRSWPQLGASKKSSDTPAWEGGPPASKEIVGPCEGLTWQPRKIRLNLRADPCESGVASMVFTKGRAVAEAVERGWLDPMTLMDTKSKEPQPLRIGNSLAAPLLSQKAWRRILREVLEAVAGEEGCVTPANLLSRGFAATPTAKARGIQAVEFHTKAMNYFHAENTALPVSHAMIQNHQAVSALLDAQETLSMKLASVTNESSARERFETFCRRRTIEVLRDMAKGAAEPDWGALHAEIEAFALRLLEDSRGPAADLAHAFDLEKGRQALRRTAARKEAP